MKAGADTVRRHNRSLVLRLLAFEGPSSRADLAGATGLTKATVSTIVGDLEADLYVRDTGTSIAGRAGRPATLVEVSDHHLTVGLVIDVDRVGICLADLTSKVVAHARLDVDNSRSRPRTAVQRLARIAVPLLDEWRTKGHDLGPATLAVPGLVDPDTDLVVVAPNLGWTEVDVVTALTQELGLPVTAGNEADLAAVAEVTLGVGRRYGDFVLVSAGIGVGAGLVIGGEVFGGSHGFGGELGHLVVDPAGPVCRCGNRGCLERYIGEHDLPAALRADGGDWPGRVVAAAGAGDEETLTALDHVADHLARALVGVLHLVDPEAIVMGGWLAPLAPWLEPAITAHLRHHVLGARWAAPVVVASDVGPDAALLGAAISGARQVVDNS